MSDIEHRLEPPKHRDGHVLLMNSYVHRKQYSHAQNETIVPHEANAYTH